MTRQRFLPARLARSAAALVATGCALIAPAAVAQDANELDTIPVDGTAEQREPADAAPEEAVTLEEFVVTASRTGDSLSETPISVVVTTDEELRDTNVTDVEVLSDRLPNAQLSLTPTNTFLFVRGLGTGSVRSAEQSVGFFVDSVFLGRPQAALFDFLDVKQVELLRGPQGAILGKNTVAGAVNIQTAPTTTEPEGYVEFLTGSESQIRGRAALSGALSDTVSARVAYSETDENGFLFNTTQERNDLARPGRAGRIKLDWAPTASTTFGIAFQRAQIFQTGDTFELSQASEETLQLYRQFDPETDTDITDNRTHTDHEDSGGEVNGKGLNLTAEWEPDFGLLRFVGHASDQTTVADLDLDISPAPFLTLPSDETYRQRSAELRFDREFAWGDISTGVYYFQSDLDLLVTITAFAQGVDAFAAPLVPVPGAAPDLSALEDLGALGAQLTGLPLDALGPGRSRHQLIQDQTTYSAFGSARWYLGDRWTVRFDGRFTRETKAGDLSLRFEGATGPAIGAALGEEEYELVDSRTENDFSPRLSVLTDISDAFSSYVTVARGFKSGGFNNLAAVRDRAEFEEERSLTYEGGLRLQTAFGLSGSIGIFRTDFENLQVAALDGTEFFVGNAAEARTQGVELSAAYSYGPFEVAGDFGYLDAEYERYEGAPPRADQDEDSQDLSGRTLQRAPTYSAACSWVSAR